MASKKYFRSCFPCLPFLRMFLPPSDHGPFSTFLPLFPICGLGPKISSILYPAPCFAKIHICICIVFWKVPPVSNLYYKLILSPTSSWLRFEMHLLFSCEFRVSDIILNFFLCRPYTSKIVRAMFHSQFVMFNRYLPIRMSIVRKCWGRWGYMCVWERGRDSEEPSSVIYWLPPKNKPLRE